MGKLKTHKSTIKRFKVTKSGKLIHKVPGWSHLRAKKEAKIKYRKNVARSVSNNAKKTLQPVTSGLFSK